MQLPSQLLSLTMLFQPSSVPFQRGHLYVTVIPQTTIPMNMLQGKQSATSTCKMLPLRAGTVRTTLCFPKFQHQRTERRKGLAFGTTWPVSPRAHSYKLYFLLGIKPAQISPVYRWDHHSRSIPIFELLQSQAHKGAERCLFLLQSWTHADQPAGLALLFIFYRLHFLNMLSTGTLQCLYYQPSNSFSVQS